MKLFAVKPHARESENAVILSVGDVVHIQHIESGDWSWMGNVFCTLPDGRTCWAMHSVFQKFEGNEAIVAHEFNSRQLTVEVGEKLEGFGNSNNGWWCLNVRGESGWIPTDCVDMDEPDLERRKSDLIAEIESAFAEVEKGDGIGLREAWELDLPYRDNAERERRILDARSQDVERWQDLTDELFGETGYYFVLLGIDPIGFRYLIPAFMRNSLRRKPFDSGLAEETVLRILGGNPVTIFGIDLDFNQRRAVGHYCEYMLDIGINSPSQDIFCQRDFTHELLETVNEGLSQEWFKAAP
jgi:hypothetical protein